MDLKKLVLLHSNDMHGDFFDDQEHDKLVGGISLLSGYVRRQRRTHKNCCYVISGDMLQGSIIDSEYKGISTIDLINMLLPDCISIGNHEADYGLGHLMFLERCAKFPVINANLFIKPTGTRLFNSHYIWEHDNMRILFIGIITEEVLQSGKGDPLLGTFVNVEEASKEIETICNTYQRLDIDLTVLLTHIGFEEDKALAAMLKPELGVDIIIGGHSHTYLEKPEVINNILIVQAGVGTNHIGRFDLEIDMDNNCVHDYTWELVPIDDTHCERDLFLDKVLSNYKAETDAKYDRVLGRMKRSIHHENRYQETELGNMFADIFRHRLGVDVFLLGSGSIRKDRLPELVTLRELKEIFPFQDPVYAITTNGAMLERMMSNFWERYGQETTHEFYQLSKGLCCRYSLADKHMTSLTYNGKPLDPNEQLTIGIQEFQLLNCEENFGVTKEELEALRPIQVIATDITQILSEHIATHMRMNARVEGRIIME